MTEITNTLSLPLPWQESIWSEFTQYIYTDRLPHAILLSGPSGIGKGRLAIALAERLLCGSESHDYACGICKSCTLLNAGSHPDLFPISIPEKSKNISIDEIRKLSSVISKTAQQGGRKVAIINPAEALNINASNALLKSLEEPQGKTVLILVAHRPTLLSATIRSRCQIIQLTPPSCELATSWLNSMVTDQTNIDKALEISDGRPLLALDYLRSDSLRDQQYFEEVVSAVRTGDLSFIEAAQQCAKLDIGPALEWFISYLHRSVIKDKRMRSNQNIYLFLDRLNYMYSLIVSGSNVNQLLMWEELLMSWRQTYFSK